MGKGNVFFWLMGYVEAKKRIATLKTAKPMLYDTRSQVCKKVKTSIHT